MISLWSKLYARRSLSLCKAQSKSGQKPMVEVGKAAASLQYILIEHHSELHLGFSLLQLQTMRGKMVRVMR